ncbi:MAG: RnfABCDGE type electron transport complex subunit D [Defluviitaleaceae bacterium]|nr:RnfABCDGE type electron transport complex subunit D [Defluviitaleaceae bacterium]
MEKLVITPTPHIHDNITIEKIMLLVLIALAPATIMGVVMFGLRALLVILVTVGSSVGFEWLYQKFTKQEITIKDYSAAVTGLLLAFNLPPTVPLWLPVVGSFVAIVVAKQLFGGLGQNFINPALAGRAFLMAAYMPHMAGGFVEPLTGFFDFDVIAMATPLAPDGTWDFLSLLIGNHGGTIGETSAILLILGGLFLVYKRIITWHIPATFIATVAVLTFFLEPGWTLETPAFHVLAGGLMLGAFFMATDYSSSPVSPLGKIIMGIGCGFITVLIRLYGGYPEGVSYAILLMNCCVPLIDKFTKPKIFGAKPKEKKAKA